MSPARDKADQCVVHIHQHFDPLKGSANLYAWCEKHGRLHLIGKNGKPGTGPTSIFTADRAALEAIAERHLSEAK